MKIQFDLEHSNINSKLFKVQDGNKNYKVVLMFSVRSVIEKDKDVTATKKGTKILLEVENYYFHNYHSIIELLRNKE